MEILLKFIYQQWKWSDVRKQPDFVMVKSHWLIFFYFTHYKLHSFTNLAKLSKGLLVSIEYQNIYFFV